MINSISLSKTTINRILKTLTAVAIPLGLASCINEYPHPESCLYDVTLNVSCQSDWLPELDMTATKADGEQIEYIFQVYESGASLTSAPVAEKKVYSSDFNRNTFSVDITLHAGNYDLYVWSDVCGENGEALYYNTADFAKISLLTPYEGDSNLKDAFRGTTSFSIDWTMHGKPINRSVTLTRPLARYILVATDLEDYLGTLQQPDDPTKAIGENAFEGYSVEVAYPLFLPSVFNNFTNRPVDAWNDMSFSGSITPYNAGQVTVGMDYVLINGEESNVQLSLKIFDEEGTDISSTGTLNVPILRNRTTIVYGKFLTTSGEGDITLNPEFKGQYNIEIN
ncbi:MAG: hypothetical protein J1D77_06745 [Muribaculaceae bacterium]|nr:hypothetical protein [Muribaculaceae bacterium]